MTSIEEKVLAVIGTLAVEGHSKIEEQGFDRPSALPQGGNDLEGTSTVPPEAQDVLLDMDISIADETIPANASPPLPELFLTLPSASQQQQFWTPTPAQQSKISVPTTVPSFPPRQPLVISSVSVVSLRRRRLGMRRRRALKTFDRTTSEFVVREQRRLQLEKQREKNEEKKHKHLYY